MKTTIETITPALAKEYLEKNAINNRHLRPSHIEALATAMRRGEWILSHQGIAFNTNGKLIDGQHRLWAIIKYGFPVQINVTRGALPESFLVDDLGLKRTVTDVLGGNQKGNAIATFIV